METTKRAKMTAAEAKTFQTYSVNNAARVEEVTNEIMECGCEAYVDVFTFNRWIAQGKVVRKGEKAIRIPVFVNASKRDDKTNEVKTFKVQKMVNVFCRHQVTDLPKK